jgi:hypothetical protein
MKGAAQTPRRAVRRAGLRMFGNARDAQRANRSSLPQKARVMEAQARAIAAVS